MEKKLEAFEPKTAREPWTAPELMVVDLAVVAEAFNGGAGDANTGS